jgi:hypothetical protein
MGLLRRLVTMTAVVLTVFGVGLLSAWPAAAKGPQSVVLISAATDKTVVLAEGDQDLLTLQEALPVWQDDIVPSPPPTGRGIQPDTGRQITVMWRGGHDTVFSVDTVLPAYDGRTAWVRKEDNILGGRPRDSWHRADPALLPLLDRLGLYDGSAQPQPPAAPANAVSGAEPEPADWWWHGASLGAGLLLGTVAIPWLRHRLQVRKRLQGVA